MDGFDFEKVVQLIQRPDDHVISMFVAFGKDTKQVWPRSGKLDIEDVIQNRF